MIQTLRSAGGTPARKCNRRAAKCHEGSLDSLERFRLIGVNASAHGGGVIMSESGGRSMWLPLGRRVTCDFLHASLRLPMVAVQLHINVAEVVAARDAGRVRPSWCSIFTKAYGKAVASRPDM